MIQRDTQGRITYMTRPNSAREHEALHDTGQRRAGIHRRNIEHSTVDPLDQVPPDPGSAWRPFGRMNFHSGGFAGITKQKGAA